MAWMIQGETKVRNKDNPDNDVKFRNTKWRYSSESSEGSAKPKVEPTQEVKKEKKADKKADLKAEKLSEKPDFLS